MVASYAVKGESFVADKPRVSSEKRMRQLDMWQAGTCRKVGTSLDGPVAYSWQVYPGAES
jgi:hypothetical protein